MAVGGPPLQLPKNVAHTSDAHTCEPAWNAVSVVPPARAGGKGEEAGVSASPPHQHAAFHQ